MEIASAIQGVIIRLVCSGENESVEATEIRTAHAIAGNHERIHPADCWLRTTPLLDLIVRRFTRDDHVMHMAFAQAGDRDPHESRALL